MKRVTAATDSSGQHTLAGHNDILVSGQPQHPLDLIDDLLAPDTDQIKGGPGGGGFTCTWCGVNGGNHNENLLADSAPDDELCGAV